MILIKYLGIAVGAVIALLFTLWLLEVLYNLLRYSKEERREMARHREILRNRSVMYDRFGIGDDPYDPDSLPDDEYIKRYDSGTLPETCT